MGPDVSLAAAVATRVTFDPARVALRGPADAEAWTYAELDRAAGALASHLVAAGVAAGDRVAWAGRNHAGLVLTLLAAQRVGAVFVPLNFRSTAAETAAAVALCGVGTVVSHPDAAAQLLELPAGVAVLAWDEALLAGPAADLRRAAPDDVAALLCSSGTSGSPKAVILTHANLWWSARNLGAVLGSTRDDMTLAVAPMFHVGGLNCFAMATLAEGGTVLVRETFDPHRTLVDLQQGVTTVFGVPAMYAALAREPAFAAADLSGVRAAVVGGAPLPAGLIDAYLAQGLTLLPSWGMTELAPAGTLLPHAWVERKPCSVGPALPHLDLELHDPDTGAKVANGAPGEIWARGPQVTPGYWQDPAATAAALHDGWLRTGDLAVRDAEGCLQLVGRLSETINSGGEKIRPTEVEDALAALGAAVAELAVVGVPDETWGESVVAVLTPGLGPLPDLERVRAVAAGAGLGRFKLPKHVVVLAEFPRTGSGKVDRRALRRLASDRLASDRLGAVDSQGCAP